MIKVSGYYPNLEGKMFDIDYYCDKHLALAKALLGDNLKKVDVEKGCGRHTRFTTDICRRGKFLF